jgi:hypothetical protein
MAKVTASKAAFEAAKNAPVTVMATKELPKPRDAFVLLRGEYDKIGPKVERALFRALPPMPAGEPEQPPRLRPLAHQRDAPAHGSHLGQPRVGTPLRDRPGEDFRELRFAGRMAEQP